MKARVILSAVGSDRPGLTQALADAVFAAGGNWLESHLSRLGGKYVGSVLVELDDDRLPDLETAARGVDAGGLHVVLVPAGDEPAAMGETLLIEAVGQDRPGIVRELTTVLARLGVNIEDFASATRRGAESGALLFHASARLTLPQDLSRDAVQDALEAVSGEIMVDFPSVP